MASGPHPRQPDPGLLAALVIAVAGIAAALTLDVVESTGGVKGDEATYVMMALSIAHDGDLRYERRDLGRFYRIYGVGPDGIFLKRGGDPDRDDVLFFGKAYLHAVAAAPFALLFGLNGLLVLNVVLLAGCIFCGHAFLAARCPAGVALTFTLAFVGASITPLYTVWLTPELLNFALVLFAYFLWLYKEAAPAGSGPAARWLSGPGTDIAAMVLLGLATYSKPPNLALAAPIVALCCWRRQFARSAAAGATLLLVTAGAFGVNALVTGDVNYQGGDRRTFYAATGFPLEHSGRFEDGIRVSTDEVRIYEPLTSPESRTVLARNAGYFLVGRHFGFLPFFFPGVVAVGCALARWRSIQAWHVLTLAALGGAAVVLLFLLPYSWSGGGGPSGNRYFLSFYGAFLFLMPATSSLRPAILAWAGGAAFTAHIVVNPFVSARQPYATAQQGALRLLPVELTMINDLPFNLDRHRSYVRYDGSPQLSLCFLDDNASLPEGGGIWITGGRTSQIILYTRTPIAALDIQFRSPVINTVDVSVGGPTRTIDLRSNTPVTVRTEPRGVYAKGAWAYLLTVGTRTGMIPRLISPVSRDGRHLGARMRLTATAGPAD